MPGFGDLRKIESEQGYEVPKSKFKQWQANATLKRALDRTRRLREAEQTRQPVFQTIPSTFREYALPGYSDIFNPLHNAIAAIRYIKARYDHPSRIPNIGNWSKWIGY
ncbi:transglycosylase SLT domain-containing protein [Desulfofundulus thermobenzoicus]|uniref:Transglycosylase SLT domain-containing protein n=1 Tax=Desulfofundulus thermobenzoicus TaxID=29376 RepID=A0A6N7ITE1_9FIRM|nr:transglycosylase SLT domain-containing protein [Desulfofundulus thermobenzoicus]MQL53386.1 transglycosylase SLT domain-containing protein [Desulfofundulus thermobenzoicus]